MNRRSHDLQRESLEEDLRLLYDRYKAAQNDARLEPATDRRLLLESRAKLLLQEINLKEEELAKLDAGAGATPVPPLSKGQGESDAGGAPPQDFTPGNHWAVLIGVSEYAGTPYDKGQLPFCANDVKAIRNALLASGYDAGRVFTLGETAKKSPTRDGILDMLNAVAANTQPNDLLLVYFTGHGDVDAKGASYLVAKNSKKISLADSAVPLARVKEILQDARAGKKIIILDACHSGANFGKGAPVMPPEFIEQVYVRARGWAVIASCEHGQLSWPMDDEKISAFTHYLIEALGGKADFHGKGFVSVQDAHNYTLNEISKRAARTGEAQTPTLAGEQTGDIILARYAK